MADAATPLDQERYISLETFRKDGTGVATPVWAAALDGRLVIVTDGTSFKVKRLRNNAKIRAAACDARGKLKGPWFDGQCRIVDDPARAERARRALRDKYGWQMWLLDTAARLSRRMARRAYLEVAIGPAPTTS
jgi:PPOX class probable F420-dependent enzyme